MKTLLALCLLAMVIHSAVSIKCYVCSDNDGNCKKNEISCSSSYDRCAKVFGNGDSKAVAKTCSSEAGCNAAKSLCENSGKCGVSCCEGDLCNATNNMKPLMFVTILAPILAYFL
ncbi:CD59 glycoprotein [Exaiptasia diaphana]|uniref:Uncharacterized protein n=1 Tax=Exaiptasia diaphana TaxID=2652724 RepID=A0A913WWE8_EXADI|nr:CD59 glycoprotein [Exaiptasia diaphana]